LAFGALWRLAGGQQPAVQPPAQAEPPAATRQQTPANQLTFRVQGKEVIVPVTVTDDRGYFVRDLTEADFRILDEGKPQRITYFNHSPKQPVVFGFLVDLSNNSRTHWARYKESIKELIWALVPGDTPSAGYLIAYSNNAELVVNTTSNGETLADKVDKMAAGAGGSALFDAINMACTRRELVKGEPYEPRRVIVIIGDGHDNASSKSVAEVLELAKRNLITIYGMSTVAYGFDNEAQATLEQLANETGGRVQYPLNSLFKDSFGYLSTPTDEGSYVYEPGTGGYAAEVAKGILNAVTNIVGEVTTQYVMHYIPDVDTGSSGRVFRRIKVDVPSLPNVKIHARDGYYPEAPPPTQPAQ
jgi:Ca-activated chloride channel family protein